jgi:hypothetical protein
MEEIAYAEGDTVEWNIRDNQVAGKRVRGTILRTGLEKFGYNDVIEADTGTQTVNIRPKDIERKL